MKLSWVCRAPHDEAGGGAGASLAGQTVAGRYRIESTIGRGPLGTVYRAEDTEHRRPVALKIFAADITPDGDEARRLLADLETAAGLMNPHLVPPIDGGITGGRLFIVEPLLVGQSLADRLRQEGPQAPLDAVRYALEVLVALDALHRHHILHLDIKPQNIFVMRDPLGMERVMLAGVGQQHALGLDAVPARSVGESRATATYLAPEIVSGKPRDVRTDLYQLGLVLYEALTGQPPFAGDPPDTLARRHVLERPPSPRFVRADSPIPDALDVIVVRCLEKVAAKRFSSAGEMTRALEQVAQKGAAAGGGGRFRAAALSVTSRPPTGEVPPPFADFDDEPPPEGPITRLDVRRILEPTPKISAPPQMSDTPKVTAEDIAALRRPRNTAPIVSAPPPPDDDAPPADASDPAAVTLVEAGRTLVDPIYRPPPRRPAPIARAADDDDGEGESDDDTGAFDGSAFPGAALDAVEEAPRRVDTPAARATTMPVELSAATHADVPGAPPHEPNRQRSGPLGAWQKRISAPPGAPGPTPGPDSEGPTSVDPGFDLNERTDEHSPIEDEHSPQRTVETPSIHAAALAALAAHGPDALGDAPTGTPPTGDEGWSVGEDPEDTLDGYDPRRKKPVLPIVIGVVAIAAIALILVLASQKPPAEPIEADEPVTRVAIGTPPPAPKPPPAPDATVPDATVPDAAPPPTPDEHHAAALAALDARRWQGDPDALAERLAALRAAAPTDPRTRRLADRAVRAVLADSQKALRQDDFPTARAAVDTALAIAPGHPDAAKQRARIETRAQALAAEQAAADRAAALKAEREAARQAAAAQKAEQAAAQQAEREAAARQAAAQKAEQAAARQAAAEEAAALKAEQAAAKQAAAEQAAALKAEQAAAKQAAAEQAAAQKAEQAAALKAEQAAARQAAAQQAAALKAEQAAARPAAPATADKPDPTQNTAAATTADPGTPAAIPVAAIAPAAAITPATPTPDATTRAREEAEAVRRQRAEAEAADRRATAEEATAQQRKTEREQRRAEVQATLTRARDHLNAGQYDLARAAFDEARTQDPTSAAAHAGLGDVAFQQERFADAVTHHRASVAAAPANAGYQVNLGMAYFRLQNFEQARIAWQKALELQPGNAQATRYLDIVQKKLE